MRDRGGREWRGGTPVLPRLLLFEKIDRVLCVHFIVNSAWNGLPGFTSAAACPCRDAGVSVGDPSGASTVAPVPGWPPPRLPRQVAPPAVRPPRSPCVSWRAAGTGRDLSLLCVAACHDRCAVACTRRLPLAAPLSFAPHRFPPRCSAAGRRLQRHAAVTAPPFTLSWHRPALAGARRGGGAAAGVRRREYNCSGGRRPPPTALVGSVRFFSRLRTSRSVPLPSWMRATASPPRATPGRSAPLTAAATAAVPPAASPSTTTRPTTTASTSSRPSGRPTKFRASEPGGSTTAAHHGRRQHGASCWLPRSVDSPAAL